MLMQQLIGQIYSVEKHTYTSKTTGEVKPWVKFRLGMDKPYRTEIAQADGSTKEVRQKTFVTVKAFNGVSDAIATFLGDSKGAGEWIQLTGHFEINSYEKVFAIEHPTDESKQMHIPIPTETLEFQVNSFGWMNAPQQQSQAKKSNVISATVVSKGANASLEQSLVADGAPF